VIPYKKWAIKPVHQREIIKADYKICNKSWQTLKKICQLYPSEHQAELMSWMNLEIS